MFVTVHLQTIFREYVICRCFSFLVYLTMLHVAAWNDKVVIEMERFFGMFMARFLAKFCMSAVVHCLSLSD